ncbi:MULTISPECIES: acyl-CoA dehydrogenase family protein [unclassified Micromonospora]|uniref:acyl-CoA dehydrogenase family protein n=1 Tax=unclassified Micromonospora TaxID=2617518 RepID=UPI001C21DF26|nr:MULTISPECIES: acyl-CoA dehydrogenase family protein [unclassified Micromonospora]MBU8860463.1 acyl-CoA dehydrogenase family protein [Micromonospora sp. WMMB482]MDM4780000.1 acyl-CoA dehydrogenase family protein [Micromonospora sp. b486]MDM4784448.1 acyl-CoA dehydrogenase family protein [Micromonospora sp. b486]MDM4784455.1 acyl-CoA dehydrogenase family protein [Micromonospora sp. b486]
MTSTTPVTIDALKAARELAPTIADRAAEGERLGCVPPDLLDRISRAGLIDLMLPQSFGGLELDPMAVVDVITELSRADGSVGFTILSLNATFFVAWLEPDVARSVLADRPRAIATVFAPLGKATPDPGGGLVVDGRWPFNSGCRNASWFANGVMVMDGDKPAVVPPGRPDWRLVFVPAADVEVLDTWDVAGLRGTGSNDVRMAGVRVPPEYTANPIFESAKLDGTIFRWSFFALMGVLFAGFPLGIARRAIDEFVTVAPHKSRGSRPLAEEQSVQLTVARAEGQLRSAHAFVQDTLGRAWDRTLAGDEMTMDDRVAVRLATGNAMRAGTAAVDSIFRLAGGSALYNRSPLQRCWRDINAGSHHGYFSEYHETRVGRALLGVPVPDPWMM